MINGKKYGDQDTTVLPVFPKKYMCHSYRFRGRVCGRRSGEADMEEPFLSTTETSPEPTMTWSCRGSGSPCTGLPAVRSSRHLSSSYV